MTARTSIAILTACLGFGPIVPGFAAPPSATYLFPAGAQQGTTVSVAAGGTFERWPLQAAVHGKGLSVAVEKEKGKLTIAAAKDAEPGVYGIRLYDEQGASPLRPFLVGTLPEVLEQEPNDDVHRAQPLSSSAVIVNGRLSKMNDVDSYAVQLHKGQTLVASLDAQKRLGAPMDALLQVVSANGFVLDENHDTHDLDPQVVFTAPADGKYVVRVFAFPSAPDSTIRFAGGDAYVYRLTLTTAGFADHAFPLAVWGKNPGVVGLVGWNLSASLKQLSLKPHAGDDFVRLSHPLLANTTRVRVEPHPTIIETEPNDRAHPQALPCPVTVSGRIDPPGDVDVYRFAVKKGQRVTVDLDMKSFDSALDPIMRVFEDADKALHEAAPRGQGRRGRNRAVVEEHTSFTVPRDGDYRVEITDLYDNGGLRYVYALRLAIAEPDFALRVPADRFDAEPGKALEIPVTVERLNGFNKPITVAVEGLPDGVRAEAVTAKVGDKIATLRIGPTEKAQQLAFRIVGHAAEMPDVKKTARTTIAGFEDTTSDLWLTVLKPAAKPSEVDGKKKKK